MSKSKSKKLELWEQIYQAEKQIKELKERIVELEKTEKVIR